AVGADCDRISIQDSSQHGQRVRVQDVVVVEEHYEVDGGVGQRRCEAGVSGAGDVAVGLGDDIDARVAVGEALGDGGGGVGRAVVDDGQGPVVDGLAQDAVDGVGEEARGVVCGDD